jgi:hypothetical protein
MPSLRRLMLTSLVLVCCCSLSAQAQDKRYKILLHRPAKVGDKAKVAGTITRETRTLVTLNGDVQPPHAQALGLAYEGQSQVLAISDEGKPVKARVTFDKFEATNAAGTSEVIGKGGVVIAEFKDGQPTFELQGGELSPEAKMALRLTTFVHKPGSTPDQVGGTAQTQKIGAHWPIDAVALAKTSLGTQVAIDPKNIKGHATLVGAKVVNGVPCLEVLMEVSIDHFIPATAALPPGMVVSGGTAQCTVTECVPEDVSLPAVEGGINMTMAMDMTGGPNSAGTLSIKSTAKMELHETATPIK